MLLFFGIRFKIPAAFFGHLCRRRVSLEMQIFRVQFVRRTCAILMCRRVVRHKIELTTAMIILN